MSVRLAVKIVPDAGVAEAFDVDVRIPSRALFAWRRGKKLNLKIMEGWHWRHSCQPTVELHILPRWGRSIHVSPQ